MALIGASNSLGGLAGSNALARLLVVISGDSSPLTNALRQAQTSMSGFSRTMTNTGRTFTRYLTLPLLGLSGAAISMSLEFSKAVAKVGGLTPLMEQTGMSLDDISNKLIDMARDPLVTAGPAELAESLYFAGSAGLKFADAMDVVKLSAQGASIGMGDAADISKVLIFALNNYAETGLDAATAMDALTAAIQEGTAEPQDLAIALGRLLPVAAEAGITFQQVTASVAALTNLGMPTRVATTSLRALFSQLLSPTIQATELLHALGVEAVDLRSAMEAGPIAAFQLLEKATRGNIDYLHDIIPQIRGFTAYLGLSVDEYRRYKEIIDAVNNSQGKFQKAMRIFAETPAFKFEKGIQSLKIAAIELGDQLIPIFEDIIKVVKRVADGFTNLPSSVKKATAVFVGMGIAVGPVMQLLGALTETTTKSLAFGAVGTTLRPTMRAMAFGFATLGIAAGAAALSLQDMADNGMNLWNSLGLAIGTFMTVKLALSGLAAAANAGMLGVNGLSLGLAGLSGAATAGIALAITGIAVAIGYFISQSGALRRASDQAQEALWQAATSGQKFGEALKSIESEAFRNDLQEIAEELNQLNMPTQMALPAVKGSLAEGLIGDIKEVRSVLGEAFSLDKVNAYIRSIEEAAGSNKEFAVVLEENGLSLDEFLAAMGDAGAESVGMAYLLDGATDSASRHAMELQDLTEVMKDYQDAQMATLAAHNMEGAAVEELADKYGVSVDYMSSSLAEFGLNAYGMTKKVEQGFAAAKFGVRKDGSIISAAATQMADALAQSTADMAESLRGSFALFDKLPEKFKGSTADMISRAEKWGDAMVQQAVDIRKLSAEGVPIDLISKLVEDGPDAVAKFADASESQIHRAVLAYQIGLGAMDEAVLAEGAHQEMKGRSMVQDFATAMLSQKFLFPATGQRIIQMFEKGLLSGDIKGTAIRLVTLFSTFIMSQRQNMPVKAGNQVVLAFAQGIASGNIIDKSGNIIVSKLAQSIQAQSDIPKQKAIQIAKDFAGTLGTTAETEIPHRARPPFERGLRRATEGTGKQAGARQVGRDVANELAGGIVENTPAAVAAANSMGQQVHNALVEGLKGSPKYFTYYLGIDLNKQLAEGLQKRVKMPELQRPSLSIYDNMAAWQRAQNRKGKKRLSLDVTLDRRRFSDELTYDSTYRGWL